MVEVRSTRSMPALLVIIISFVLLALLATLQYRWLGQLSSGERERMRSALNASVAHFCEDFDRELARGSVAFRMDSATLRRRAWNQFGERYARWVKQFPHPRLINAIYLVSEDGRGQYQVMEFDPAARTFEPAGAPADLERLRQKIEERRRDLRLPTEFGMPPFPQVFAEVPLLVIPILPLTEENPPSQGVFTVKLPNRIFYSYIVARLDSEYIQREFIPALVQRYFSGGAEGGGSDYQLSIISQSNPAKVIYSTALPPLTAAEIDGSGTLLTLQPQLVENFSFEIAGPAIGMEAGMAVGVTKFRPKIDILRSAPVGAYITPAPPGVRAGETGAWQLLVKHRTGSLNEAVERLRRRNMFVSFSILLLLAASAALIYVSAHRARRLAHQQIEFVAGVSHELRVPVSVVCLTSANLADGLIRDPQQIEKYGHLIQDAGRRLAQSIEQILDFAGTEMIRKPYQFGEVDVEELIASALDACQPEWQSAGFTINTALAKPLPPVWGDRAALGRALQNLISNAVKYSGENRLIEVNALAPKKSRQNRGQVQITVTDHGIGIEPAERDCLFEAFRRGSSAVAAQIPGNGLGLYFVRRIVAAHGGEITVRSVPGHGSAFTLHLASLTPSFGVENRMEV